MGWKTNVMEDVASMCGGQRGRREYHGGAAIAPKKTKKSNFNLCLVNSFGLRWPQGPRVFLNHVSRFADYPTSFLPAIMASEEVGRHDG